MLIPPDDIKSNSLVMFENVACCDQSIINKYISFGRHKNTYYFYLCLTYLSVPEQLIRDNVNVDMPFGHMRLLLER